MKAALCTETVFPIYGVERRVYEMAKRLPKYGIQPTLITSLSDEYDDKIETIKASNPTIKNAPKRDYANCIKYSVNTARLASGGYDVIDANGHMALIPCFIASKKSGKPVVATIHDVYGDDWRTMYKSVFSCAGKYVENILCKIPYSKLIVLNNTIKRKMISMGIPEDRLTVIYSGIDVKKIDSVKAGSKVSNRVVYVGRLAPQKNLDVMIRAFSMIKHEAEFRIVGSGSEGARMKSMCRSMGIDVDFVGNVDNLRAIKEMKEASILVLTSSRENFGIVPLEAMRCKTAVVSTKTEGPIDYIENGKNGFLADIGSAEQVSRSIDTLLSEKSVMSRIRKNAFRTAGSFDWDIIVKKIADVYEEVSTA